MMFFATAIKLITVFLVALETCSPTVANSFDKIHCGIVTF